MTLAALALTALLHHTNPAAVCTQQAKTPEGVVALIRCAAPKLGVSTDHALYIAHRESHYEPWAKNPSSSASGVFQVVSGTWRGFVSRYRYGHLVGTNVFSGRDNVILSLRAVKHAGWGPWGG